MPVSRRSGWLRSLRLIFSRARTKRLNDAVSLRASIPRDVWSEISVSEKNTSVGGHVEMRVVLWAMHLEYMHTDENTPQPASSFGFPSCSMFRRAVYSYHVDIYEAAHKQYPLVPLSRMQGRIHPRNWRGVYRAESKTCLCAQSFFLFLILVLGLGLGLFKEKKKIPSPGARNTPHSPPP